MDQISFLKFGSVLSKAKNLMLLQSVPRPDPVLRDFYTKYNLTEMLLIMNNGSLKKAVDAYLNSSKQSLVKQYKDQSSALESFISILWHTKLPCHDLKGVTSEVEGEASMLKLCKWKRQARAVQQNIPEGDDRLWHLLRFQHEKGRSNFRQIKVHGCDQSIARRRSGDGV